MAIGGGWDLDRDPAVGNENGRDSYTTSTNDFNKLCRDPHLLPVSLPLMPLGKPRGCSPIRHSFRFGDARYHSSSSSYAPSPRSSPCICISGATRFIPISSSKLFPTS